MKIDLDDESLNLLEQMYLDPTDNTRVLYSKFIEDVEIVFTMTVFNFIIKLSGTR